ncbi:retrovirus-related pol polyprotein from transposon TNT 1-94, partial [Tanacetum coccineum]
TQLYGVDYEETFSPVADVRAIRILIAIAAFYDYEIWQMDFKTAFLNGYLDEDIYMVQHEGFVDPKHLRKVCKLQRSIYGLKQASRSWNKRFDEEIKKFGFAQNLDEPCVYQKASGSNVTFLILYFDDIIIMGNHIPSLQSVKDYLGKCFPMKDLREAAFILGIKIYKDRSKRLIRLSQNAYMDKILKRYKMDNSKRGHIPMQERLDLNKIQGASTPEEVKRMKNVPYVSVVGSIMYAVRCTRPDVVFAQNITSRFQQNPGEPHWTAVKNILKYLRNIKDMLLVYGGNPKVELRVDCYCNAGFETDRDDVQNLNILMDALALTPFYRAFLITADVPAIYMQEFWSTVSIHRDLGNTGHIAYLTDVNVDYLHQPWIAFATVINKCLSGKETGIDKIRLFTKIVIDYFMSKDQSISRRNKMFWHTARDDTMFTSMRCISRHEDTQVYGTILLTELTNQAMLESKAYHTYYAFASGEKAPKPKYIRKKADSDTSPKKKPVQATKGTRLKSKAKVAKPNKKKQPTKKTKAKGLAVLSEVALTEAEQLKLATKRSKKDFHMSHASSSGDVVDTQSKVLDEQQQKTSGTNEGTGTIIGVPDVPIYESKSEKESWGDNDDENDSEDVSDEGDEDNDGNNDNDGDDYDANDDKQEGNDMNDDDEETDSDRTESDRIKILILDQSNTEFYEEEEMMYDDEDDEVTKELYEDVNVNLGNEDIEMTNADQGATDQQNVSQQSGFEQVEEDAHVTITPVHDTQKTDEPVQSSSVSFDFTSKLLNLENPSPADNEIASLKETSARHATAVPENISGLTTTVPLPPPFFNPLQQEATPTPTPITLETITSLPALPDFAFVFKFNERVFNLEKDVSEIKQVDQYAQALSSVPAIVDRYMDNKLGEAINKAILAHNLDCRQEAQDEKNAYIELVDTSMRSLIKEEVNTQLPQILSQAVLDFATPTAASLFEFKLTKILIDKIEKNKSYDKVDYKKKLYDALVESYNTDKYLFDSYGDVFSLKRSRDDSDKDQEPSVGSDRGKKRRKSSKDAESSRDSRSKEKKTSSTSKDASQSQHKSSSMSAHAEEPSYTVEDSGMQQDQEFVMGDNDEQPADKEVTKADWFKKPELPPTPDPDWSKKRQVDFRPPQTWLSQVAC